MVTQPNQGAAAARVLSAGDAANPDELKDDLEKYEPWESWDSSRRNGATPLAPGKNPADLTTMIRSISRVIYIETWRRVAARFEKS